MDTEPLPAEQLARDLYGEFDMLRLRYAEQTRDLHFAITNCP